MYVTRRISELLKFPDLVSEQPKEPNSGFLVIQDEESETYSCFGKCKNRRLKQLPFPQDKELTVKYTTSNSGQSAYVSLNPVFLIPALNQPLSSNLYFAIEPHGKHIGKAFTCSKEEDKATCCFCRCVKDVKEMPLDLDNIYQEFEIVPYEAICSLIGQYFAKSVAPDGFPPLFLRRKGWDIYTNTPDTFKLEDAKGVDLALRARLPELNAKSPFVVGKWYCPFIYVKEATLREQVEKSMYYEMTLEQRWEQIFSFRKDVSTNKGNSVVIDAFVETEEAFVSGNKASWSDKNTLDGVIWFKGGESSVGLREEIVTRLKWEQKKVGWEERQVKINKVEEFKESWIWNEVKCYVLVESYKLKRMDGSLVMSYDFKHCNQMRLIWE